MSAWLITVVTVIYVGVAISFVVEGKPWLGLTFFGYAVANVGLILSSNQS